VFKHTSHITGISLNLLSITSLQLLTASMENLDSHESDMEDDFFMNVRQVELLERRIDDWAILENGEKQKFLQARFREVWSLLYPDWDWNGSQPSLQSTALMDQKYYWTRQVCLINTLF
jgi:hypothetical protein